MTHAQAAVELRWSERTLRRRLAEARDRLKARLGRRGLVHDDAMLGAVFLREARACVPAGLARGDRPGRPGHPRSVRRRRVGLDGRTVTHPGGAQDHVRPEADDRRGGPPGRRAVGVGGLGRTGPAGGWAGQGGGRATDIHRPTNGRDRRSAAETGLRRPGRHVPVRGRVLDPDGKPVAGAGVYVRPYAERRWSENDPMAARQKGRVASTDADGRFHFELDKGASDGSYWRGVTGWHRAQIAVAAPGFAPAWVEAGDMVKRGEMALRLVRDDVPVRGRVVDPQGRPVAGVAVRVRAIWEVNDGVDLDAMLASGAVDEENMLQIARGTETRSAGRPRPGEQRRPSGPGAGTPGPPAPTVGSRSRGSGATASPGWNSTAAAWQTAHST